MAEQRPTNRLIKEKSPYLLQHAHNPVDWYPWGEEAFKAAQQEDKPIFLSIGYATCHWCHVMEQECFEDEQIAVLMNESFINVKVDREELPEVDALYMEFAQSMLTGATGWPLNLLLTPQLKPFFAATYLPPQSRRGMVGMSDMIRRMSRLWKSEERENLIEQAARIVEAFQENLRTKGDELPHKEQIENAAEIFFKLSDPVYGGLRAAPKFPIGYQASFLLRCTRFLQEGRPLFLVERTLIRMYQGGIYDHLGGGFSRYSVDEQWLVPHFEKMLYDNAILTVSYLEAWQVTKNPLYKRVVEEICRYVLTQMTHPDGGFFSAEDADSEDKEGYFYTWTKSEIQEILGQEESELFCRVFGVTDEGNFEGRNILHLDHSIEEIAQRSHLQTDHLAQIIERECRRLFESREKRIHPFKDDKIITAWNGLMIYALAEASSVFRNTLYLEAAEKAAHFIKTHMRHENKLYRRWRDNDARFSATLDDYACLIKGVLSLFEATGKSEWLSWALDLTHTLATQFKAPRGAFYQTDGTDPSLLLNKCHFADGAEPSGNAVHAENLLRLYGITWNEDFRIQVEEIFKAVKPSLDSYLLGYCYHLIALQRYYDLHAVSIVIALNEEREFEAEIRQALYEQFAPSKCVIWRGKGDRSLIEKLPHLQLMGPLDGKTTVYLCHHGVCKKPLKEIEEIIMAIKKM